MMSTLNRVGRAVASRGRSAGRACRDLVRWGWMSRDPARYFLTFPPGHFYSPLPSPADIKSAFGRTESCDEIPGIALHPDTQLALLAELAVHAREWPFPETSSEGFRYYSRNSAYLRADGSVLYAMLRHLRPARVIEVGSGFSSAMMLDTADRYLDPPPKFMFIEPYPENRLLKLLTPSDRERHEVVTEPVQRSEPNALASLDRGDILFIDSSHVSKVGSDLNFLLFEVLPRLAPGVVVHVHDLFWPFEYPEAWFRLGRAWNEAYLVRAFLQFNAAFRILLWPSFLETRRPVEFSATWPVPSSAVNGHHASLWLERLG